MTNEIDTSATARIKAELMAKRQRVELPPHLRSTPEEDAAIDAITRQRLEDARAGVIRAGISDYGFSVIGPKNEPLKSDDNVQPT